MLKFFEFREALAQQFNLLGKVCGTTIEEWVPSETVEDGSNDKVKVLLIHAPLDNDEANGFE